MADFSGDRKGDRLSPIVRWKNAALKKANVVDRYPRFYNQSTDKTRALVALFRVTLRLTNRLACTIRWILRENHGSYRIPL
jgi:hypothetical protein